jgi:hypothetical protein
MNKTFGLIVMIMVLALATMVSATPVQYSKVAVQAKDSDGGNLNGVNVSIQWLNGSVWTNFSPISKLTQDLSPGQSGITSDWDVLQGVQVNVTSASIEGYTCTTGDTGTSKNGNGQLLLRTTCTADPAVPEFGVIAAALALVGAMGMIFVSRRN